MTDATITHFPQRQNVPTLDDLADALEAAKAAEAQANDHRLAIERQILEHPDMAPQLKDEGTHTVGRLRVSTGYTRKWSQQELELVRPEVADAFWPFKTEHKEDRRMMKMVEERLPDLYAKLSPALTLTPRKPSVTIVENKD